VRGAIALLLIACNTILMTTPLFLMALLKFMIPAPSWRKRCNIVINGIAGLWTSNNNGIIHFTNPVTWDVQGLEGLKKNGWYMVVANHQSWVDILVLQKVFNGRIPLLKFFLKKELIWVPFLGLAWWALDFPFMKRYSKSFLKKHPQLKGKDMEITQKACEKFRTVPVSVMNFLEGTRFTPEKRQKQVSPYTHLLKPKAGGIAFVLSAMGKQMRQMLDVTIAYPGRAKSFWQFLCGRIPEIRVRVASFPIDGDMIGDYFTDKKFRVRFQNRLNVIWEQKDILLSELMNQPQDIPVVVSRSENAGNKIDTRRTVTPDMLHSENTSRTEWIQG
jgi:1-acyl-sn-glycerol-3-phosphate acyltransferase